MVKIIRPDGHVTYYYYKKKVGRHKKTGPKKRKKKRGAKKQETWEFKIIQFNERKQEKYIGVYHSLDEVNFAREILEKRNEEVIFPKKYVNNGRKSQDTYEFLCEYVILKKNRDEDSNGITRLRNEYGKFVDHKTTSKNWLVYDKFPCLIEETFWVYGYNPKKDRKTFQWIFDNLIKAYAEDKSLSVIVYVYNNKLILKNDDDFNFVICKNISDAIRMYNEIAERSRKIRNVFLTGMTGGKSPRSLETIEMIREKTGWEDTKIFRRSTRS